MLFSGQESWLGHREWKCRGGWKDRLEISVSNQEGSGRSKLSLGLRATGRAPAPVLANHAKPVQSYTRETRMVSSKWNHDWNHVSHHMSHSHTMCHTMCFSPFQHHVKANGAVHVFFDTLWFPSQRQRLKDLKTMTKKVTSSASFPTSALNFICFSYAIIGKMFFAQLSRIQLIPSYSILFRMLFQMLFLRYLLVAPLPGDAPPTPGARWNWWNLQSEDVMILWWSTVVKQCEACKCSVEAF